MPPQNLWTVFAETAARFGDKIAVEVQRRDRVDAFTYRQLHDMASSWASWLRSRGLAPGERCAILAHNDAHWCAAYLGILKSGLVAVPLDTNYSAEQIAKIVADSGAKTVIVSDKLRETAAGAGVPLESVHRAPDSTASFEPLEPLPPSSPAVILYTGGTTSDPKGVVLTHANLLAERDAAFAVVDVSERDAVLGVLPLFHSLAQLANLLLPFAVGARVVYLETLNSTDLLKALSECRITIFACVPQFFYLIHQRIIQQVQASGLAPRLLFKGLLACNFTLRRLGVNLGRLFFGKVHGVLGHQMRLLVTGGSKFDPAIGKDLYSLGFTLLQAYGLTETSAAATITTPDEAHFDTVGRPLPGVEIKIVPDEALGSDGAGPDGRQGEIAIRGAIVMQGYHNRPDATAEVIRDGWFYTGDLGRMDDRGRITITGRKKEMIVLASGKNIYPEEIEAHYRASAFIKEICVMGLAEADRPTSERLFAVVVPDMERLRERKIVNAGDIIRFEMEGLAAGLPPHKRVLGYDIWFEPLPRTTTQKIKRHEIARLVRARRRSMASTEAVLDPADQEWLALPHSAAVLDVVTRRLKSGTRLFPDANLELDLGLDSMERVELLMELEQTFQTKLPHEVAAELFTVRQLVSALSTHVEGPPLHGNGSEQRQAVIPSWTAILQELPPANDPVLSGLLERRWFAAPVLFTVGRLLRPLVARVELSGLEHLPSSGAYIISPNHQSYLDPFLMCTAVPFRIFKRMFFVGAVEYFKTRLTRWFARIANLVPVDPDSNLVPAMKAGAFGLAHGKVLVLFPEGERSIDGHVKKFKKGAPILAQHLHVPIVPVAIKGVFEIWPRNRGINWRAVWPWSGHRVRIAFGDPMQFPEDADYSESANALRRRVEEMWNRM
ncbi:MAG TPA: AMP-binding protein [Vicinamibacterales bacterium]|nr:AMP-binding protein [Vicinamibacterales bacterium]